MSSASQWAETCTSLKRKPPLLLFISEARPAPDDSPGLPIRLFLFHFPAARLTHSFAPSPPPSLPSSSLLSSLRSCAQPRAPSARHYQASGPYCITDGPDRRERRQPACFLERGGGVQLSGGEEEVVEVAGERRKGDLPPQPSWEKRYRVCLEARGRLHNAIKRARPVNAHAAL